MQRSGLSFPLTLPAWCTLVFGLGVSAALFSWMHAQEKQHEHADLQRRAQFRVMVLQQEMNNAVDALQVVNRLFVTNGMVSREQFHVFTQPLLARYPYIEAFGFHQLVCGTQRTAFEAQMGASFAGFHIHDVIDAKRTVAAVRSRYLVINYVEPMAGNEAAIGHDISAPAFMDDAVQRATDSGLPSATGLIQIVKDMKATHSVRILMAVYKSGAALDNAASRRLAVIGYNGTLLRASALVETILASAGSFGNLDVRVYGAATPDESKLVYGQAAGTKREAPWSMFGSQPESYSHNIEVAGTTWHLVISAPAAPFFAAHSDALLVLLMGVLTTLAATAYLQSMSASAQRTQLLVARRTDELRQANEALSDGEQRARELADLSSDWFWEQDEHFQFTDITSGQAGGAGPPPSFGLGMMNWDLAVDPDAADWQALRALLKARQPFRNFEFKWVPEGMPIQWISASGKPLFDPLGQFKGYRGTGRNISARKEAEEQLQQSRSELRKLVDHKERVKEHERKRIARDIHDELGQNLMALRIDLSLMAAQAESRPVTREQIDVALKLTDTTIRAVRSIINDLRPAVLDLGLHAALEWQAQQFEQRSGIACDLLIDHDEFALDDSRAATLFRIVQEALSNVLRHARASQVQIGMQLRDGGLFLEIADNGVGLAADSRNKAKAFGLTGIEERIHALGGTCSMMNNPGPGMTILVSIPMFSEAAAHPA